MWDFISFVMVWYYVSIIAKRVFQVFSFSSSLSTLLLPLSTPPPHFKSLHSLRLFHHCLEQCLLIRQFLVCQFIAWLLSDESDKAIYRERYSVPLPSLTIPDAVHGTFDEFTTRTSRIVPLAMALFRAQTINATNKLKFLFDFNWNWLPGVWHRHDSPSAKVPLTSDDYQRMLNHINAHIETIIEKKLESIERNLRPESDTIDPTIALHIATIVKEQIIQYKYVLTDADIERIANVVREKITSDGESRSKAIPLTQANLEEMSRLIQQKIEIHQHEWNMNANANANGKPAETDHEKVDVHEILYKILTSVELADFVNKRFGAKAQVFSTQLSDHQITIDTLRNDMNALKEQLKSVFAVNDMAKESIDSLHAEHSQLSDRLASMQAEQNEQLKKLLESIDVKLNAFNEKQISSIDNHIRNALVEIFGYRSSDGKPLTNADLANWIQSIFVAKELLETRLSALNAKYEHRFDDEINHMAEVVIRNVSETIKRDIAIALEQSGSERRDAKVMHHDIDESLNEAHIQQLIQKALAVYDADKTGMVDYALESSGGEVLSTRYSLFAFNPNVV